MALHVNDKNTIRIMARFKLKLNGTEMKSLAMVAANIGIHGSGPRSLQGLVIYETLERLWSRMRNMYRIGRDNYTLQLNATETDTVMTVVCPQLRNADDPYMTVLACKIEEALFNQVNNEINIYNAMRYGAE
ncbi:MAG: hypothetical protein IKN99_06285 [Bacteroidales bacterium]|nr:hypothetical protein [Bacteroidales bacterium]